MGAIHISICRVDKKTRNAISANRCDRLKKNRTPLLKYLAEALPTGYSAIAKRTVIRSPDWFRESFFPRKRISHMQEKRPAEINFPEAISALFLIAIR